MGPAPMEEKIKNKKERKRKKKKKKTLKKDKRGGKGKKMFFLSDFLQFFSIQIKPGIWIPVNAIVCMVKLYFVASLPSMLFFSFILFSR